MSIQCGSPTLSEYNRGQAFIHLVLLSPLSDAGSVGLFLWDALGPSERVATLFEWPAQAGTRQWLQLPERRPARLEAVLSSCPSLEVIIDRS